MRRWINLRPSSSLGYVWFLSVMWLIGITPILCTTPMIIEECNKFSNAGIQDIHGPEMTLAPLLQRDLLLRGVNMPWYSNSGQMRITLNNGTKVLEDITPYWFKIGFNQDILRADLDALSVMGVRHIRITALIFQFLNWHPEFGSTGINASVISTFNAFLEEVANRNMILTVVFLAPLWSFSDHPSLMEYFRIFNSTTGLNPSALYNLGSNMAFIVEHYRNSGVIHTWELVSDFSLFTEYLSDSEEGFGLEVDATALFDFLEDTTDEIRSIAGEGYVTISDGWPLQYDEGWWNTGFVPVNYDERLLDVTDYVALRFYTDNTSLRRAGSLNKHEALVQVGSTQLYNYSREKNSEVILKAYIAALREGYSGFCPWAFSQNIVFHEENDTIPNHHRHDWSWDALLLFSLYREDSIKFINTTNWYVLSTEPQFDRFGRVSFSLFHRPEGEYPAPYGFTDGRYFDPSAGGTFVTVFSGNLLVGDMLLINREYIPATPLFNSTQLDPCDVVTTVSTIYDVGQVKETGIKILGDHSWDAIVDRYDTRQIGMHVNSTGPIDIMVKNGGFTIIEGSEYTVILMDPLSGNSWQEIIEADMNQSIMVKVNSSSIDIRIIPTSDIVGLFSLGLSGLAIIVSIVIFYFADRIFTKKNKKEI